MAAIEILGLEKTYMVGFWRKRPKRALQPLHLTVEDGEIFGFLGPNGAGKTTTLKMLMGLVFPTAGTARILGKDWTDPEVKAQIGFLPEQPYFYDYLTAHELLEYYGQLSGVPARDRKNRVEEVLQRVGLTDIKGMQLRKFSKGMLQRAGIAQAILHNPKVVFLDEPMSGLDPLGRRDVRDLIQQLQQEGKTVFFSTHILSDAEALCDRVAIINKGELRGVGAVEELTKSVQGKVELVWAGTQVPASMKALGAEFHVTGDTVRAVIAENQQDTAIDALRRERLRLISITPVRTSLVLTRLQHLLGFGNHNFPAEINRLVPAGGFSKPCNTTGTATDGGYAEATFAWNVTMKLKAKLEKSGATVVLTRTSNREDRWGPCVDYRGRAGNTLGSGGNADLKLSIHGDGSLASGAHGFHVIYPPDRAPWTDDIFKPSKRLALVTKDALVDRGFAVATYIAGGDGLDERSDLGTLNLSDVPVVMLEAGNMRDSGDAAVMTSAKGQARYARALAVAARAFLG